WKQLNAHLPAWHTGSEFLRRHELKQVPQFEMSLRRSGEAGSHIGTVPPVPAVPPLPPPPEPPTLPPVPAAPVRSILMTSREESVRDVSGRPPSGGISSTPKSQTRSRQPDAMLAKTET